MFLKRLLPKSLKQFLWFVFKSPQRQWIGFSTCFSDLRAWLITRSQPKVLQPISICIGIKNRSDNLLRFVLPSLNACRHQELIELSIFDCGSNDHTDLLQAIKDQWRGDLVYTMEAGSFARSYAFNQAVKQSSKTLVLVCDADMSLPTDVLEKVNRYSSAYSAWFPHVWYTNEDGSGRYYTESTGMMASFKSDFLRVGGYDESIKEWGKEDWFLFFAFYHQGLGCVRSNEPDFVHHYHPSLKPEGFVNLF